MALFATPTLWADFTQKSAFNYIFNGTAYGDVNSWLAAASGAFSRGSSATYTNSAGLVVPNGAANNIIRFDFDSVTLAPKGILLEGSSTNNFNDSAFQTSFGTNWSLQNATGTINAASAPDGTNQAASLTPTGGAPCTFQSLSLSNGVTYTVSCYAKGPTGSTIAFQHGGTSSPTFNLSLTWQRFSWQFVSGGSESVYIFADQSGNNNTTNIWGAQVEALSFVSSYIPTTASSANRAADSLTATPISGWYNALTSSLLATCDVGGPIGSNPVVLLISDGSSNNQIGLNGAGSGTLAQINSGGSGAFTASVTDSGQSAYVAATKTRAGLSAVVNNFQYVRDGGTVDPGSSGAMPVSPNALVIGNRTDGNESIYGHFYQLGYWPTVFTSAQLKSLTNTNTVIIFDANTLSNIGTTLTNKVGRYFSRRDYAEWLNRIKSENEESAREHEALISSIEAERNLSDTERADRDYSNAEEEYGQSEGALFNNLTSTNHIKFSEAKERRDRARKERDHHYYMAVVKKAWDEYNNK